MLIAPFHLRVESLAVTTSLDVDFSDLRHAIRSLQKASAKLDHEKVKAEHKLRKLLHKLARRHFVCRVLREKLCQVKRFFGRACAPFHDDVSVMPMASSAAGDKTVFECSAMSRRNGNANGLLPIKPRVGRAPAWAKEQREREMGSEAIALHKHKHKHHNKHHKKHFPHKKFKKAVKHIREVNKKLKLFERGFIHEDGIKDREWYRNLDVAPGKWLGECAVPAWVRLLN